MRCICHFLRMKTAGDGLLFVKHVVENYKKLHDYWNKKTMENR